MPHRSLIVLFLDLLCMKKKCTTYKGDIDVIPTKAIHLNINHLEPGRYILNIIHKNKIIKKTTFNK